MYRTIDAAFWTDPKVKALPAAAKYLFLYFITNPHTHVSGFYYLPRLLIQHETGLTPTDLDTVCDSLSSAGLCRFDRYQEIVWVRHMMRYQGRGEKNQRSAARHLREDLHDSPLMVEFLEAYPEVKPYFSDRVSDKESQTRTPEQEQEQEQEQESPIPDSPKTVNNSSLQEREIARGFGEFQSVRLSPQQESKLREKLNSSFEEYIDRLDRYSQTNPKRFRDYKSHYAAILSWFDRDQKGNSNGTRTNGTGTKPYPFETKGEAVARRNKEAGARARELLRATTGNDLGSQPDGGTDRPIQPNPERSDE